MRCSICGARLKKEGEICNNCYKFYQEEEDLKKDVKEVLKVHRKYSIEYEIKKYTEILVIFIICSLMFLFSKRFLEAFLVFFILAIIMGILMFIDKRIAMGTKATFFEKKVVYSFKFLFFKTIKIVKYNDIKDIAYFQTFRQKRMGYGDVCFYAKGVIPGSNLFNGFQIKNVENVEETVANFREIIGIAEE